MKTAGPFKFGRYLLTDRIAVGGMSEIFLARAPTAAGFEKNVIIKRLLPHVALDAIDRFVDEIKLVCQLKPHPNIVPVHELGEVGGVYYLAMDYVDGVDMWRTWRTLAAQRRRLPATLSLHIVGEVVKGLEHAYQTLGLVHRDVTPSNILVSRDGDVKLIGFGTVLVDRESNTMSGVLRGRIGYMSPEQVGGLRLDPRSDLFSLGVVLGELLLGRRLFHGKTVFETLFKLLKVDLDVLDRHQATVPKELVRIVRRALEREPGNRYQTAAQLHDEIRGYLMTQPSPVTGPALASFVNEFVVPHLSRRTSEHALVPSGLLPSATAALTSSAPQDELTDTTADQRTVPDQPLRGWPTQPVLSAAAALHRSLPAAPAPEPSFDAGGAPAFDDASDTLIGYRIDETAAATLRAERQASASTQRPMEGEPDSLELDLSQSQPPLSLQPEALLADVDEADLDDGEVLHGRPEEAAPPGIEVEFSPYDGAATADAVGASLMMGAAPADGGAPPDEQGSLATRTLVNLLFRLYVAGETGTLVLDGPPVAGARAEHVEWVRQLLAQRGGGADSVPGQRLDLHLEEGQVHLAAAEHREEVLVACLLEDGTITREQVESALALSWAHRPLASLIAAGTIGPLQVSHLAAHFVVESVLAAFGWRDGRYAFFRERPATESMLPLGMHSLELIARGVGVLDNAVLDSYLVALQSFRLRPNPDPPATMADLEPNPLMLEVARLLDGSRPFSEVLGACLEVGDPLRAKQAIYLLHECELLERVELTHFSPVVPQLAGTMRAVPPLLFGPVPLSLTRVARGSLVEHPCTWLLVQAAYRLVDGTLKLGRDVEKRVVHLRQGRPVFVESNVRDNPLGGYLIAGGSIDSLQLRIGLRQAWDTSLRLGESLVQLGFTDEESVHDALERQVQVKLANLLHWTTGTFVFTPETDGRDHGFSSVEPVGLTLRLLKEAHAVGLADTLAPCFAHSLRLTEAGDHFRSVIERVFGAELVRRTLCGAPLGVLVEDPAAGALLLLIKALRLTGLAEFVP